MDSTPMPQAGQEQAQTGAQQQQDPLQDFRQLAQQVNSLGQKYPEAAEGSAQMLKLIQQMMVRVAGNSQRNPPKEAPPAA